MAFIVSQQLKVFLFPYMTNTFEVAAKVRVVPGHAFWWSSNELNVHALRYDLNEENVCGWIFMKLKYLLATRLLKKTVLSPSASICEFRRLGSSLLQV